MEQSYDKYHKDGQSDDIFEYLYTEHSEYPQKKAENMISVKPVTPAMPDKNPDPTLPRPGGNEPEKNDPTRIDEPQKIDPTRIDDPPKIIPKPEK